MTSLNKALAHYARYLNMRTNGTWNFSCLNLRHREKLLKDFSTTTQAHQQRTITTFFRPITNTNATSQSRARPMGSWLGGNKGVTIDWAIAICPARRPRPHGPWSHYPCHRHIKVIISCHRRCFPCFGDLSILDWPTLEIFQEKNYKISDLRILHVAITRFFSLFLSYLLLLISNIYFGLLFSKTRQHFNM